MIVSRRVGIIVAPNGVPFEVLIDGYHAQPDDQDVIGQLMVLAENVGWMIMLAKAVWVSGGTTVRLLAPDHPLSSVSPRQWTIQ